MFTEVKRENRRHGSDMLDVSTVHGDPLTDDCWMFTVCEALTIPSTNLGEPSGWQWNILQNSRGKYMNKVPLHDLLVFIRERTLLHIARQQVIIDNYDRMHEIELCEHGSGLQICRECNNILEPETQHEILNMGHGVANFAEVSGGNEKDRDFLGRPYKPRHPTSLPFEIARASLERSKRIRTQVTGKIDDFEDQVGVLAVFPLVFLGAMIQRFITYASKYVIVRFCCAIARDRLWTAILSCLSIFDFVGDRRFDNGTFTVFRHVRLACMEQGVIQHVLAIASTRDGLSHFALSFLYYLFLPTVAFFFTGFGAITSFVIGDAISLFFNGLIFGYYRRLQARGANRALQDWAAMRARPYLTTRFNYILFASVVGSALAAYKLFNAKRLVNQGGVQSVWNNERAWSIPYTPPTISSGAQKTTTSANLITVAEKHIAYVRLYEKKTLKGVTFNIFPVKFGVWIAPGHAFDELRYDTMDLIFNGSAFGANLNRVPLDRAKVVQIDGKDLCLVYIVQTGGFMKDMTAFYTDDHKACAVTYVYRNETQILRGDNENVVRMEFGPTARPKVLEGYLGSAPYNTFHGLCGAVQIAHARCPSIVSMHIAGVSNKRESVCVPIFKREIDAGLLKFSDKCVVQTASFDEMDLTDGDKTKHISVRYHEKSPLGYIESGHVKFFGSLETRFKAVAAVKQTQISHHVESVFGFPNIFGNPHDLRSWKPWFNVASTISNPCFKDPTDLQLAIEDYYKPILDNLDKSDNSSFKPLTDLENASGSHRNALYKHIDIKRSSGYPFRTPKSNYITPVLHSDDVETPWHFEVNDALLSRVADVIDR